MVYGMSTSDRSNSADCLSATCESRMHSEDLSDTMCNPCPRTILLPISPTAQCSERLRVAPLFLGLRGGA